MEAANWLAAIVTSSTDAIIGKTCDGVVASFNFAAERLFGHCAAEIIGKPIRILIPADRQEEEDRILARIAAGECVEHYETIRLHKSGNPIEVSVSVCPVRDASGRIIGAAKIARDITERKRTEAERQKFVSLADHSAEFIAMCGLDLKPFYVNDAGRRLVGLDSFELTCAARVQDCFFPEDQPMITNEFFPRVLRDGSGEVEVRFRHFKTGGALWMICNVFPLKDEGGRIVGYATLSRDITGRKRAEEALRESEEQFRTLADAIPQLAWIANADGWITWYNRRWYEYTGTTPEQMEGWGWQSVHDSEMLPEVLERWKASIATGEPFDMIFPLRGAGGVFRRFLTRIQPLKNAEGRVVRWFGTNTDVDEIKRAEEALRESEGRLRRSETLLKSATDNAGVGLVLLDRNRRYLYANRAYSRILGLGDDKIEGKGPDEVLAEVYKDQISPRLDRAFAGERLTYELARPDATGDPRYYTVVYEPLRDDTGQVTNVIVVLYDITAPKQAMTRIAESEERLSAIVDTAVDAIIVIDETGIVQSINPAGRIFGYTPDEILGKNVSMLMPEPYRSVHQGYIRAYLRTGDAKVIGKGREIEGRRKDGTMFPADITVAEWRVHGKRYFTGTMRDISERKQREEKIQLLLREVNHRSKNLLGVVQAIASQMAASERDDFNVRFCERLRALAANQDLLVKSQWQGVELEDLVRAQLAHFEGLIGSRIEIAGPPLYIAAEAAQPIAMALHELATNAGKYGALSSGGGKVSIAWDIAGNGTFHLSWAESAGPAVASPSRRGFGTTVIVQVPETQLDAEVVLEFPPSGVTWRLCCPAKKIL